MVKCTYSNPLNAGNGLVLPPLVDAIPASVLADLPPRYSSLAGSQLGTSLTVDSQVSATASRLLDSISRKSWPIDIFVTTFFETFHRSLPILNQDLFRSQLQDASPSAHFSTLLLSMILISHLSSKISPGDGSVAKTKEELYPTLKSMYSLLLSTGNVTVELVQAGVIIATYEYCQALHRDAWLSIGTTVRLGQVLGLHLLIKERMPVEPENRPEFEMRRCVWWGVVVLERYVFPPLSKSRNGLLAIEY